jgi:hypothetical protein
MVGCIVLSFNPSEYLVDGGSIVIGAKNEVQASG